MGGRMSDTDAQGRATRMHCRRGSPDPKFAESHHRIANSLSLTAALLRMQRERSSDRAVQCAIRSAEARIASIAKFHSYLHQRDSKDRVNLADFFREALPDIGSAIGVHSLLAVNASVPLDVPERVARQLLIVVNELALNARKHGYDGREGGCISVELDLDGANLLKITLADSGGGLPDGFDPACSNGLGLRIVLALVNELGGSLTTRTKDGAHFTIEIPLD